ncbi:MAG: transferrin receptor-like dimerization domain-containing protein [Pseudomonadales bacterium]
MGVTVNDEVIRQSARWMIRGAALVTCVFYSGWAFTAQSLLGFQSADTQLQLEADFRASLSAEDQMNWARTLSARPHHAGSEQGRRNVQLMADLFREWGYQVEVETFDILLPVPKSRHLEMLEPTPFVAGLIEDIVEGDDSSAQRAEVLPPYNAFSTDGDVTAELVFVNYGIPEDYELLERYGVSVAGKIVIARYGKSWRGIKPKLAAEKGAIGALIYSDPADDGYGAGDVYPDGPFKNDSGVQRGSVMDMPTYPGDVLTPGKPAIKGARRLAIKDAPTITAVPVLPISYRDAEPLLAALGGAAVPREWQGGLPHTYHIGPGPARVRLALAFDWQRINIENVIARLPGSDRPDEWILRGNHHDGWNHGAADPISGMVALLDEARAVGALARAGRGPKRTIVYAAWDAEEPGLIGSTEWVEKHRQTLIDKAAVYINTDGNSRGFIGVGGSHTLEPFFNEVIGAVTDPQTGATVAERLRAKIRVDGTPERREELTARADLRISPLGSGSDYTPFLQHAGIASANLGFGGEGDDGSYHTLYDTFEHFSTFVDPGFRYGVALADVAGTATLRLANADLLPFRFSGFADNVAHYLTEIEKLADDERAKAERINGLLNDDAYRLALDPSKTLGPPTELAGVPHFNFAPMRNATARLTEAARALDARLAGAAPSADLDRRLMRSERALTSPEGLPGREWYRHQIYAPGFYTGYGVKTLPRMREAIEAKQYSEVDAQIASTAGVIEAFADYLETAATSVSAQVPTPAEAGSGSAAATAR